MKNASRMMVLVASLALAACTKPAPEPPAPPPSPAPAPATAPAAAPAAPEGLSLDDGKKWMADQHTADSVTRLEALVSASPASGENATLADFTKLGGELQAATDELVRGCRMVGPAHQQLHHVLERLVPSIKALSAATDPAQGRQALAGVNAALAAYREHFDAPR